MLQIKNYKLQFCGKKSQSYYYVNTLSYGRIQISIYMNPYNNFFKQSVEKMINEQQLYFTKSNGVASKKVK